MTASRTPDWGWWRHVPTLTLREAVALSLNLDPARSMELLSSQERREFGKRQTLATRCLGESLDGPLNSAVVHYEGVEPVVRLKTFAAWSIGVEWDVPAGLVELADGTRQSRRPVEPAGAGNQTTSMPGSRATSTIDAFDVRLGWISLSVALAIIRPVIGECTWEQVTKSIRVKALPARCLADGVTRDFEPHWLDFLAWDRCDGNVLWFDREKAWRAFGRPADRAGVPVQDRAENIVVSIARCADLWPSCSWPPASGICPDAKFSVPDASAGHQAAPDSMDHAADYVWVRLQDGEEFVGEICPGWDAQQRREAVIAILFTGEVSKWARLEGASPPERDIADTLADSDHSSVTIDIPRSRIVLRGFRFRTDRLLLPLWPSGPPHLPQGEDAEWELEKVRFAREPARAYVIEKLLPRKNSPFMPTGAPGRPSKGTHVIRIEFDRRRIANECKLLLRDEAAELEGWFRSCYPTAQPVKRKTIENNIRADFRQYVASPRAT
jgi:hypothetical protein